MAERETWHGVVIPAPSTLAKYGLALSDWKALLEAQGYTCGVCGRVPASQRMVIDHQHAARWRHMPDEKRKTYVRGVCCHTCNHYVLTRYANAEKHEAAATYLRRYAERTGHDA